jgi:serine/threonine protein phosphatase PrpC
MAAKPKVRPQERHLILEGKQLFGGGHAEAIGKRTSMEDACAIVGEFAGPNTQFYGLYDGHGGAAVSQYCSTTLHILIAAKYRDSVPMADAIRAGFAELNAAAVQRFPLQGSTAAVVIIADDIIYSANVGDSRVVLIDGESTTRLSYDHNLSDPAEQQAVVARGGAIIQNRIHGTLSLSRSIGDGDLAEFLSAEPCLKETPWNETLKVIIACDGVWDVVPDEQAAALFKAASDPGAAARAIKDEALDKGSDDNVTVICVNLKRKE